MLNVPIDHIHSCQPFSLISESSTMVTSFANIVDRNVYFYFKACNKHMDGNYQCNAGHKFYPIRDLSA